MIPIRPSATADTRSCDFANVSQRTLLHSSVQHIADVRRGLAFFASMIDEAATRHDEDKITDIEGFHADFVTGFAQTGWWDKHRQINRHHLMEADGVPADVNLIDVLDMITDCVMAGMARTGSVYALNLSPDVLMQAFQNTVELLKANVEVVMVVGPTQRPAPHPFYGDSFERGNDPFHAEAFEGLEEELGGNPGSVGERRGGWFLLDGHGNAIGFVPDGTPVATNG